MVVGGPTRALEVHATPAAHALHWRLAWACEASAAAFTTGMWLTLVSRKING